MRIFSTALAAFCVIAAAAAAETTPPYSQLPDTSWGLIEWNGVPAKPAHEPRLRFGPSFTFSGRVGCNTFSGHYSVSGERITLDPGGWTKMICSPELMKIDARVGMDLRRVARMGLGDDGILVARAEDGHVIFRFRRAAALKN